MIVSDPYPDGRAVLSAITEKARAAHRSGLGSSVVCDQLFVGRFGAGIRPS